MTLNDMVPYILGNKFTRDVHPPARCTPVMYEKVVREAAASDTFAQTIGLLDNYRAFLDTESDVARFIPVSEREEMFYCLKNGGYSPDVPAKCIYVLRTQFKKYGSASLALKTLPNSMFTIFFQKNYLNGCCMRDVIKSFVDVDYEPLSLSNLRIQHGTYDEVYVADQDMVALLPKDISGRLTAQDLSRVSLCKDGLEVDGLLLRFMANHYGACNSIYDLREVV